MFFTAKAYYTNGYKENALISNRAFLRVVGLQLLTKCFHNVVDNVVGCQAVVL